MKIEEASKILELLKEIEVLKNELRHSWTSQGRQESVAEHIFRAIFLAFILEPHFKEIDINRVIKLLLVHDLGEIYIGDIPAFEKEYDETEAELEAVKKLTKIMHFETAEIVISLWNEFAQAQTREAKLAKAIDKMEAIIQHNEAPISSWTKKDYDMQLDYGRNFTDFHISMKTLRLMVDDITKIKKEEFRLNNN